MAKTTAAQSAANTTDTYEIVVSESNSTHTWTHLHTGTLESARRSARRSLNGCHPGEGWVCVQWPGGSPPLARYCA